MSNKEIDEIGERSVKNNTRDGLTGVLFCFNNISYQILEGPDDALNRCYARILKDSRHKDIFCLEVENITTRQYGDWAMKTVRLDESNDSLIKPIRTMLNSLAGTHYVLERYSPREVINGLQAGKNPLAWTLKNNERTILFSDIFSSTTLAESLPSDQFERILQVYYDVVNRSIVENGGTISKLTGDGLMAYFSRGREGDALNAAIEICRRLDDSLNSAARLESVTRKVDSLIVFDDSLLKGMKSAPSALRKLGLYQAKGKAENMYVYSVDYSYTQRKLSIADLKAAIRALKTRSSAA
jgi:hypothetical protein